MSSREFQTLQDYDDAMSQTNAAIGKGHLARVEVSGKLEQLIIASAVRGLHDDHRAFERRREQLEISLRQIDEGFGKDDGYFDDIAHLYPWPGLRKLEERLASLRRERDELAAELLFDPRITKPYRVVPIKPGSPRKAINVYWRWGSTMRKLQVGDVIRLHSRAAAGYADFLEEVDDEATPATPVTPLPTEETSAAS